MSIDHEGLAGQPNGRLAHEDDWRRWCPICQAEAIYFTLTANAVEAAEKARAMDSLTDAVRGER